MLLIVLGLAVLGWYIADAMGGDSCAGALCGLHHPRTVHQAHNAASVGQFLITDLGTGHNDGRVLLVDLDAGTQQVLMSGLPSTNNSGQRYASLAGPSGAASAPDGTVCAVIGDGPRDKGPYDTVICTNPLGKCHAPCQSQLADLKQFEQDHNPDGLAVESNPYDIVSDGAGGWFVSDAAANDVVFIDKDGNLSSVIAVPTCCGDQRQGVPTGLGISLSGDGGVDLRLALFGGTFAAIFREPNALPRVGEIIAGPAGVPHPVGAWTNGKSSYYLSFGNDSDASGSHADGAIYDATGTAIVTGLDHPTGFAPVDATHFLVCEESHHRCRIVPTD